jgi:peptide/nickel transport system substrate-binding protein
MECFRRTITARANRRIQCLTALFCLSISFACSNPSAGPAVVERDQPITLTIGVPHPTPEDPLRGLQGAARLVSFEGLSAVSRDGHPRPRLAESWTESPDGLSWEIKLRPNAYFHDGSPVDAPSVRDSLHRSMSGSERMLSPGLDDITAVETPSSHTLLLRLRQRSTFLMDDLTLPISKRGPEGTVGTGAYLIDSTSADEIIMRAFRQYYRGAPTIDRIRWKVYPTVRTAWAAMMRGEIDFLYEVGQDTQEFIQGENSVAVFPFLRNYVYAIALNSAKKPFSDSRVRRALNYAVDRRAIVDVGFKGHATPESGSAWREHWAYDSSVPAYSYEPERAAALLNVAKVADVSYHPESGRPPARFHFVCILPEGFPLWEKIGLLAQRDFAHVGVDMTLETLSVKEFNARIMNGSFDAVLSEFIVGNTASRPFTFWSSNSKMNAWGYRNPRLDSALYGIRRAANEPEYRSAFRQSQLEVFDDPPAVFLALGETSRAVSKRFHVVAPPRSDILSTISDWQLEEKIAKGTN